MAIGTSVVVKRWEFRQETRIRMFDELLFEVASKYLRRETEGKAFTAKVSKEVDYSAIKLYHAARISGYRETVIVGPISGRCEIGQRQATWNMHMTLILRSTSTLMNLRLI